MPNLFRNSEMGKQLVWNTDTQKDFIEPTGKLYVDGADKLKPVFKKIISLARDRGVQVVNTADWHLKNSKELSTAPDWVSTFPEHCMAGTEGAEFVNEAKPFDPLVFEWDKNYDVEILLGANNSRDIVIHKDAFDVFVGNTNTKNILKVLSPSEVYVFGVTTNVCVHYAILGLVEKVGNVYVVKDAIKELPNIPLPYGIWESRGVKFITSEELVDYL